jgi:outer membrane protein OmpA-like peptidoglycan-associated protein
MDRRKALVAALVLSGLQGLSGNLLFGQEPNPTAEMAPQNQDQNPAQNPIQKQDNGIYLYRVKVVQRNLDAVNYLHRSGSTKIGFEGTTLLPTAKGSAKVTSERGGIHISANFQGLPPANGFGPEYLTYVLWAITPDGRPNNLGEVLPDNKKNNIEVTTALQSFGMIVTAEPYFSVTQPSDVVVLQNIILNDKTNGVLERVNAHYLLLPRGTYAQTEGSKTVLDPITRDEKSPLELYEANNAIRIAQMAGAEKYAPEIMKEAMQDLQNATDIDRNKKGDRKMEITYARQAVQRAEDARLVTLRKQAAERQYNAELAKRTAQNESQQSQLEAERARAAQAEADAERARAEAAAAEAQAQAVAASKTANDANQVRERLRSQLNSVLATSETARGLIVNMSDVLFATGKYALKPDTKISLAKVAGILQAYPGLKLQVEGYTDSTGSEPFNQKLSENRADAVRDFLVTQGVPTGNISATGYGEAKPVADNSTAQGRQQNRRVNLVVSGDAIGVEQSSPDSAPPPPPPPPSGTSTPPEPQQ